MICRTAAPTEIAARLDAQIQSRVPREGPQHVIKKWMAGGDVRFTAPPAHFHPDLGFRCLPNHHAHAKRSFPNQYTWETVRTQVPGLRISKSFALRFAAKVRLRAGQRRIQRPMLVRRWCWCRSPFQESRRTPCAHPDAEGLRGWKCLRKHRWGRATPRRPPRSRAGTFRGAALPDALQLP